MRGAKSAASLVEPRTVLIVGGGIAGIEALMALADLGERRLALHLVSRHPSFVLRPQILGEPWGGPPMRLDLEDLCRTFGATFSVGTATGVDLEARQVRLASGEALGFERLLLAPGARAAPAYSRAHTLSLGALPKVLAEGSRESVAIVVPAGTSWTLPAYELALLSADTHRDVRVVTPEEHPLEAFGAGTYAATNALFHDHGLIVETGAPLATSAVVELANTVVSLPLLAPPSMSGVPLDPAGFIRVDARMAVAGAEHVFAAGDATDSAIKQGGLASQQADTAAGEIARSCGSAVAAVPYSPVLRGKLTAPDGTILYLRRALDGNDAGFSSDRPLWKPPGAVCAWRLSRWVSFRLGRVGQDALEHVALPSA